MQTKRSLVFKQQARAGTDLDFSGVKIADGLEDVSSEKIVNIIEQVLKENEGIELSDLKLTQILNERGIKIVRRTVSKYRLRSGI